LATCPDDQIRAGGAAVAHAAKACELTEWKYSGYIDTLAAAAAEVGDFESAAMWQEEAIALAVSDTAKNAYVDRLALYRASQPYRDKPQK
jgi:hypothetical protein